MKKSKIYTRSGDTGETALVSGNRVSKADLRIDVYGELDELNSRIGFSASLLSSKFDKEKVLLTKIQSALFDLGSNIACEFELREKYNLPQITNTLISEIEAEIDRMDSVLVPLKNFILPGGSLASGSIHLARTCSRNAERKLVRFELSAQEEVPVLSIMFLNRLSDYFFVLSRYVNKVENCEEVFWTPKI